MKIFLFVFCLQFFSNSYASDFSWWEKERSIRQEKLNNYLRKNRKEFDAFSERPLGNTGIPFVLWSMFREAFPQQWNEQVIREMGCFPSKKYGFDLPEGFAIGKSSIPLINKPVLDKIRVNIVNLTCAGCHTARVIGPNGDMIKLIGAPTNTFNAHKFRDALYRVANQKNFNPEYLLNQINTSESKYGKNWPYHSIFQRFQSMVDKKVFKEKTELVVSKVKENITSIEIKRKKFLTRFYGPQAAYLVDEGIPGGLDAFSTAAFIQMPENFDSLDGSSQEALMKQFFGLGPPVIDVMSAWNQNKRNWAQWDGNIPAKLMRNLGSAIAVIRDPVMVDFHLVEEASRFVADLPSPPYPFQVDKNKIKMGEAIFNKTCLECHGGGGKFIPLNMINTDPNRAKGLTDTVRKMSIDALKVSCKDANGNYKDPRCNLPDDQIIISRSANPGYVAQPLDGIWARSPYLHNGSVPTLYHLLVPGKRPTTFFRGNLNFDQKLVGYVWDRGIQSSYVQNTRVPGLSNVGHSDSKVFFDSIDFEKDQEKREALLEYLKTL